MAKIVRKVQKIFGMNSGFQQIAQFGSLANTTPNFTTDPTVIQALSEFTDGWFAAVIGGNSPAIEDMNALCFLFAYQLAYLMQEGIAEWDATTTYYIGSLAQDSSGYVYVSATDTNLNNPLTGSGNWIQLSGLTKNTPDPLAFSVKSGYSLTNPNLTVPSGATFTVDSGGSLYSFDSITVLGTLTINGTCRVI